MVVDDDASVSGAESAVHLKEIVIEYAKEFGGRCVEKVDIINGSMEIEMARIQDFKGAIGPRANCADESPGPRGAGIGSCRIAKPQSQLLGSNNMIYGSGDLAA